MVLSVTKSNQKVNYKLGPNRDSAHTYGYDFQKGIDFELFVIR